MRTSLAVFLIGAPAVAGYAAAPRSPRPDVTIQKNEYRLDFYAPDYQIQIFGKEPTRVLLDSHLSELRADITRPERAIELMQHRFEYLQQRKERYYQFN